MTTAVRGREMSLAGHWFYPPKPSRDAALRLYLLPHAGGGGLMYQDWVRLLPTDIAARALTLPGRQGRFDEPAFDDWDPLYEALRDALLDDLDGRPFALFGHCLGAQLGFRLATRLEAGGGPTPVLIGMSGWSPVGYFKPTEDHSRMPEAELVGYIRRLDSFPAEVYENPELLAQVLPGLRADLRVAARFVDDGATVTCPLVSYGGDADPLELSRDAMSHWAERSARYLGHSEHPGGHFFLEEQSEVIVPHFVAHLRQVVGEPAVGTRRGLS